MFFTEPDRYFSCIYPERVIPSGISSLILFAKGMNSIRQSTFGTRNQKSPAKPFVYAFSVDVNSAGAHIHVAAMLSADIPHPVSLFPTQNLSTLPSFFVISTVAPNITTA